MNERDLEPDQAGPGLVSTSSTPCSASSSTRRGRRPPRRRHGASPAPAWSGTCPTGVSCSERGQQLDPARADRQVGRLDALCSNGLAMLDLGAEEPLVRRRRLHRGPRRPRRGGGCRATARGRCRLTMRTLGWQRDDRAAADVSRSSANPRSTRSSSCVELLAVERLLLEQRVGDPVEGGRCLVTSRWASSYASSVRRACSWSRSRFVSSERRSCRRASSAM